VLSCVVVYEMARLVPVLQIFVFMYTCALHIKICKHIYVRVCVWVRVCLYVGECGKD